LLVTTKFSAQLASTLLVRSSRCVEACKHPNPGDDEVKGIKQSLKVPCYKIDCVGVFSVVSPQNWAPLQTRTLVKPKQHLSEKYLFLDPAAFGGGAPKPSPETNVSFFAVIPQASK
jgi:hypothetical protein